MTQLHNLVYVSSAVRPLTEAELRHLSQRAQERNRTRGVTGVLLFDAGNFMHYIEGPREGLDEVYRHIRRDPLHSGIIELCHQEIDERVFEGWSMGVRVMNAPDLEGEWCSDPALEKRFSDEALGCTGSSASVLLQGFWQRGRHR